MRESIAKRLLPEDLVKLSRFQESPGARVAPLIREFGLAVKMINLPDSKSGSLVYDPNNGAPSRYTIVVNKGHTRTRQRFTAMHELGHYTLHRRNDYFPFGDNTDRDNLAIYLQEQKIEEREANAFAIDGLVPFGRFMVEYEKDQNDWDRLMTLFDVSRPAIHGRVDEYWRLRL
jgi:hypothetical protein